MLLDIEDDDISGCDFSDAGLDRGSRNDDMSSNVPRESDLAMVAKNTPAIQRVWVKFLVGSVPRLWFEHVRFHG